MIDKEIKKKTDCMGCYACAAICPEKCITMPTDEEGFWYPVVDHEQCIKCRKCVKVCPIVNKAQMDNQPQGYAVINKSLEERLTSSSGGTFSVLAKQVLAADGVVFGAAFDDEFQVKHRSIDRTEVLSLLKGSKYVQSKIGETYIEAKHYLDKGRKVLFTGTPCQISGLLSYLGKDFPNLLTSDIICHGVPSPMVWSKYLAFSKQKAASSIRSITFRSKETGWQRYSVSIEHANGSRYLETHGKDVYMQAFLKDVCLRPSCYACEFKGKHRQSDLTLADFWGVDTLMPEMDDDQGTSLVMVNTPKGRDVFQAISNDIDFRAVDIDAALVSNSAALRSAALNPKRESFLVEIDRMPFDVAVKKYCSDGRLAMAKRRIRQVLSRVKKSIVPRRY